MRPFLQVLALFIIILASAPLVRAQTLTFTGTAYSLEDGSTLYVERHTLTIENGRAESEVVRYETPDGQMIAEKKLTYGTLDRPSYTIELSVQGLSRAINPDEYGVAITQGATRERVAWPEDDPAVIDGGFHYFIQARLAALKQGQSQRFAFLAPTRASWTPLKIKPVEVRDDRLLLELQLQSRLINWLVDPIQLTYTAESGQLLTYQGLTNIPRPDGDGNYRARIEYDYPEGYPP